MMSPGPVVITATFVGYLVAGFWGSLASTVAIFLPSFLLVLGVVPFWGALRASPSFRRALTGTNAAVVGILLAALYTPLWTSAVRTPVDVLIAALALAMLTTRRVIPVAVVVLCAAAGQLVGA